MNLRNLITNIKNSFSKKMNDNEGFFRQNNFTPMKQIKQMSTPVVKNVSNNWNDAKTQLQKNWSSGSNSIKQIASKPIKSVGIKIQDWNAKPSNQIFNKIKQKATPVVKNLLNTLEEQNKIKYGVNPKTGLSGDFSTSLPVTMLKKAKENIAKSGGLKKVLIGMTPVSMLESAVPSVMYTSEGIRRISGKSPEEFQKGYETANDIAHGLRGALSVTPMGGLGTTKITNKISPNAIKTFEPTTQREKTAEKIGKTTAGFIMTSGQGGIKAIGMRLLQGIGLGTGMQFVSNIAGGKNITTDLDKAALDGAANSWQLAFTNIMADKFVTSFLPKVGSKIISSIGTKSPTLTKITSNIIKGGANLSDDAMVTASKNLKFASKMGFSTAQKGKLFIAGAKQLFGRALLEAPIENTWFSAMNNLTDEDKRGFLKAWIQDLGGNVTGNLLFAGIAIGKRGTYDFNKKQIDAAVQSFKNVGGKMFDGSLESQRGSIDPNAKVTLGASNDNITPQSQKENGVINSIQTINDAIKAGDIEGARNLHQTFSQDTQLPKFEEMVAQNKIVEPNITTTAPKIDSGASSEVIKPTDIELQNAQADVNQQTRGIFEKEEITLLNKVKAMLNTKAYQEGDIESLRKDPKKAKIIELALETVWSANPNIKDEQGALDFIQNLPTKASTQKVKSSINDQQYQNIVLNSNDEIFATAIKNGGITIDLEGRMPSQGYSYSPYKETELILDKDNFTVDNINQFKELNADKLSEPGNHLGIWEEEVDGVIKTFIDVSKVGPPTQATIDAAEANGQLGVFDLGNFVTIYTKLSPKYEKTNRVDINQGEGLQSNLSGSEGSNIKLPNSQDTTNGKTFGSETSGTGQKVEKPIPDEGEAIRTLPLSMAESPLVNKQVADSAYSIYQIKPNEDSILEMEQIYNQLGYDGSRKLAFESKVNGPDAEVNNLLGIRLLQEAQNKALQAESVGNQQEADKFWGEAVDNAREISVRATLQGRAVQIWSVLSRLTPEGMLKYAQKELDAAATVKKYGVVQDITGVGRSIGKDVSEKSLDASIKLQGENLKVLDEVGNDINAKFGGQMTVPGTESVPSQTTAGRVATPEQTTSIGKTKTGIIIKGKKSGTEIVQEKIDGVEISTDPEKSLAQRIRNYVKDPKDKAKDPIRDMINTLFSVAKQVLPEKTKKIKDPMELIANAIKNKAEYKETWNEAKKILEAKYGKNSEVMGKIEEFLTTELSKPFPEKQFNTEVGRGIKENEINIGELVKKYYTEVGASRQKLSDYLIEKAGLSGKDALELEKYTNQRFNELTSLKKQSILDKMLAPVIRKESVRKDIIQKMIEYSNLGGFDDKKYFETIATKLNIPVLDAELARTITVNMQKIQGMEDGEAKDNIIRDTLLAINKKIGLTSQEAFTAFRYQNILSGLGTQERNIFQNTAQALVVRPAQLAAQSILEVGRKMINPKAERQIYFSDLPKYYANLIQGIPQGLVEGIKSWKGLRDVTSPDITAHRQQMLPKVLRFVSDFMEASDKFYQGAIGNAETKLRMNHGMDQASATAEAKSKAAELLFRKPLDPKNLTGQGGALAWFDKQSMNLQKLREKAPMMRWFIPFISTPMNVAKQWIEYTPGVGLVTLPGNKNMSEQLSKQMVGSIALAVGALAAGQGNTTWAAPTDAKEKELWYASGRKPYSFKIGNKWIPMSYLGVLYPAFALPAAYRDKFVDGRNAMSDTTAQKALGVASGMIGAFADQTFLTGLSNWVKVMSGDIDYSTPSQLAFTTEQAIPMSGAIRWINTLIDPRFIESKGFIQSIQKDMPLFSKSLPAYTTPLGEQSMREPLNSFLPYAIGTQNDIYEMPLQMRNETLQQNAVANKTQREADAYLKETKQGMQFGNKNPTEGMTIDDKKLAAVATTFGFDKVMNMPEGTELEQIDKRQEGFKMVEKIMDSEYPQEIKNKLYESIGLDNGTVKYYSVARQNLEYRTALVSEKLQSAQNQQQAIKIITDGLMPVNGRKVVTSDLITDLYEQGIISKELSTWLKKLKYDEQTGKVIMPPGASGSGSGGKKVPFPSTPKLTAPKMSVPRSGSSKAINLGTIKSIKLPNINLKYPQ